MISDADKVAHIEGVNRALDEMHTVYDEESWQANISFEDWCNLGRGINALGRLKKFLTTGERPTEAELETSKKEEEEVFASHKVNFE